MKNKEDQKQHSIILIFITINISKSLQFLHFCSYSENQVSNKHLSKTLSEFCGLSYGHLRMACNQIGKENQYSKYTKEHLCCVMINVISTHNIYLRKRLQLFLTWFLSVAQRTSNCGMSYAKIPKIKLIFQTHCVKLDAQK